MVDFQPISSTHILWQRDDANMLLDHALEKSFDYIIRKNGSYYEAILGGGNTGAGTIAFGGSGNVGSVSGVSGAAVLQAALNLGKSIQFKGTITCDTGLTVDIPNTSLSGSCYNDTLSFTSSDGLTINEASFSLSNCTLEHYSTTSNLGLLINGTINDFIYHTNIDHVHFKNWATALKLNYAWHTLISNIDTSYSQRALHIFGQSVNNTVTNCVFYNNLWATPTVYIERQYDAGLGIDAWPEGLMFANSSVYGGDSAIVMEYAKYNYFSNVIIDGWSDIGVSFHGGEGNKISDSWVGQHGTSTGFALDADSVIFTSERNSAVEGCILFCNEYPIYFNTVTDCSANNNTVLHFYPTVKDIFIFSSSRCNIVGNNLTPNSQYGIYLQGSDDCNVSGNIIFNKTHDGITIYGSDRNSIVGNNINTIQHYGIDLDIARLNTVSANKITDSGLAANNTYPDIFLVDASCYNSVMGNVGTASQANKASYTVLEYDGTNNYNVMLGNVHYQEASGCVSKNGANSIADHNI